MFRRRKQTKRPNKYAPYRSKLEAALAVAIFKHTNTTPQYETERFEYTKNHRYTPDFILPNGIIIEVKGWFRSEDRSKHLAIKKQRPDLDIRFVFQNASKTLNKTSHTTYAAWCDKHGFPWAEKVIPTNWFK